MPVEKKRARKNGVTRDGEQMMIRREEGMAIFTGVLPLGNDIVTTGLTSRGSLL